MKNLNLEEIALPQEIITVDDVEYLVTAMSATDGLQFMEKHQDSIDKGKADLALMKQVICKYVCKDNKAIDTKRFDVIFARKFGHLSKLYSAVLEFNFDDLFQTDDGEKQE